ncbi:MAG TPA: cytochrome B [Bacteroidales bacterium]|jgi:hypothetical protein|nr:cytochrome B [Bacteroidales bacterium]
MVKNILISAHSGLRWIVLLLMVITVIRYFIKWRKRATFFKGDKTLFTINLSVLHIQLLTGIVLYFLSDRVQFVSSLMENRGFRFFTIEHAVMMIIAVVLVTIASAKIKRTSDSLKKFSIGFWYTFFALLIILAAIPWPFMKLGTGWF